MRTFQSFTWLAAALGLVILGSGAALGQDEPSAILNAVEVRQLVARAEPADHARLVAHFSALADRSAADAKRHTAMGRASGGNPNRSLASDMRGHCKRLADVDTASAATLRELSAYHRKLAAGEPSTAPAKGARFEAGAGAREPNEADLSALAGKASTPADHRTLEEYFLALAKRYDTEADRHVAMGNAYRSNSRLAGAAVHCDRLVKQTRAAEQEARAAAAMHGQLAGAASK